MLMAPEAGSPESTEKLEAGPSPEAVPVADGEIEGCTGERLAVRNADRDCVADDVGADTDEVDAAPDCDLVAVGLREETSIVDLDCDTEALVYWEAVDVTDTVTLGLAVVDAVSEGVCVTVGVSDGVCDAEGVADGVKVVEGDAEGVSVAEGVTDPDAEPLWLPLPLPLFVASWVELGDREGDCVWLGDGVCVRDCDCVRLWDCVMDRDCVWLGEAVVDCEGLSDALEVAVGEGDPDGVGVAIWLADIEALEVALEVALALWLRVRVWLPDSDWDADCETLGEPL